MTRGSIAVLTVSYYSGEHLARLIKSLKGESEVRILVANNAIGDELQEIRQSGVEVVDMVGNIGYGGAINALTPRVHDVDWYLIVNPDVEMDAGALGQMTTEGESDDAIGVVGPLIRSPDGAIYPSARRLPSLLHGIGHALFAHIWPNNPWTHSYLADRADYTVRREAGWLSGSCILVRSSSFHAVGGFDEKFFMYFEDVDLCERIAAIGSKIVFAPAATVVHAGGHSTLKREVNRSMIRAHHRSAYKYLSSKYRGRSHAPLRAALRVSLAIRGRLVKA